MSYIEIVKNGTLRWQVMGDSKNKPSLKEEAKMIRLIHEGMEHGVLGFSTGLTYNPGKFADTNELLAKGNAGQLLSGNGRLL